MKLPIIQRLRRRTCVARWVRTSACCPACQVEPTIPCHTDGWELPDGDVHPQRVAEAERTAA